jgi:hypothetical protein
MENRIINGIEISECDFTDAMTFEDAVTACEKMGNGWRLPTIREAVEIFDKHPHLLDYGKVYCTSTLSTGGQVWLHLHSEHKEQQYLEDTYCPSHIRFVRTHDANAAAAANKSYLIQIAAALKQYIEENKENNILLEHTEFFGKKIIGQFTWEEATEICNLLNDGWRLPLDGDEVEEASEYIKDLYGCYWTQATSEMYGEEPGKAEGGEIDNGYKGHALYEKTNTASIILLRDINQ